MCYKQFAAIIFRYLEGQEWNLKQYVLILWEDDIRHIDWRVTTRTGKFHIKTFQAEYDRKIFLVVDANPYMRFGARGTFKSI